MADTDGGTVPDGGAVDGDRPETEPTDKGGIIDIERLPGGSRLTAIRADLVTKYQGYQRLDEADKETVRRWGLGSIVSHWVTVIAMFAAAVFTEELFSLLLVHLFCTSLSDISNRHDSK